MIAHPAVSAFDEELFGFDFLAELDREPVEDDVEEYAVDAEGHEGVWRTVRGR